MAFENTVDAPSPLSYGPTPVDFQRAALHQRLIQARAFDVQQAQRLAALFANGVPQPPWQPDMAAIWQRVATVDPGVAINLLPQVHNKFGYQQIQRHSQGGGAPGTAAGPPAAADQSEIPQYADMIKKRESGGTGLKSPVETDE